MAFELGPHNIRVNTVNPTLVLTAMGKANWSDPAKADTLKVKIPLGRFAGIKIKKARLLLLEFFYFNTNGN